ncbi:EamA-like transporter family protein [Thalassovita taeanensis]|uniref:EamA-like transporter family protein n=2 Tax=Thalassovita taeanensis TaxID=657014 RepID=A0A1H8Z897_9RHOB|nr:EamA-like transporter family protein [Thalassovita taeanensis]
MILLACIWGASFLSTAVILREVGYLTAVALRLSGAVVVLWAYVAWRGLPVPRSPRVWGAFLVMGVLNNALPFTLITWGQLHIPSGLTGILNASTAVFGVVVAAIVFADERLRPRKLIGVALGFAGAATAIGVGALREVNLTSLAQLALIGSSLCYAFAGAWGRAKLSGLQPQVAAAGMLTGAAIVMAPYAIWAEGVPSLDYSLQVWSALLYLSVLATAAAYLLYYRVLAMAGSGNLLLVTLMVAPIAILLGAVVLGEALPPRAYVGFALLAAGLLVIDGRILRVFRNRV